MKTEQGHRGKSGRRGISKIEVLIAVVVCAILLAVMIPSVNRLRETARQTTCRNNLRQLGTALQAYHNVHQVYPPAALWKTDALRSLALHQSRRFDLFAEQNWCQLLLPFTEQAEHVELVNQDTMLPLMTCPSDTFATNDNPFVFMPTERDELRYARGNYAINAGSNCFDAGDGDTAFITGDHAHLEIDYEQRTFRLWGNGVAGFNVCFSDRDFENGRSTLVALEEVRAGVHPYDPRGAWSLGQIGSSITWAHGVNGDAYGPNNQHPRSDDIINCGTLHSALGTEQLMKLRMPCVSYIDQNFQATSRSQHPGGVMTLMLDGGVRFFSDSIAPDLWHVMHSRETPGSILNEKLISNGTYQQEQQSRSTSSRQLPEELAMSDTFQNQLGMTFVQVPAGTFEMGRADIHNQYDLPPEAPQHRVEISQAYALSAYEVTRQQWQVVMSLDPNSTDDAFQSQFPITSVSWDQAQQFCEKLTAHSLGDGYSYRLPTEAEWEFAARGGRDVAYEWRRDRSPKDVSGEMAGILPALPLGEVGRFPPNELGLFDMRGNAWEWCSDWFARDYYCWSRSVDPAGPADGFIKVVRGSDWTFVGEGCKISYPMLPPWKANRFVGFRVVCERGSSQVEGATP